MNRLCLQILFCLLCTLNSKGQQVVVQSLVNLERLGFNPSITGSNESSSIFIANRTGSNLRYTSVQCETFFPKKSIGMGLLMESYQSLLETQNSFRLNVAYRLKTQKGFWQMGLAPIAHNYSINTHNLNVRNLDDALIPKNNLNRWAVNFNAGILHKTKQMLLSISVQNVSKGLNPLASSYGYLIEYQQYTFFGSYAYNVSSSWKLVPALYAQQVTNLGNYVAASTKLQHDCFFVGLQYGLHHTWAASVAFNFQFEKKVKQTMLGYSLVQGNNGMARDLYHEVFVSFSFAKKSRSNSSLKEIPQFLSPIYF
ncbi:MAG TPA: hypothetical protein DCR46_08330 [Cytophagales bacterium]|nr:hypothetical protein [Cytophagales bacterium]